jgi:hypothetical protein
VNTPTAGQLSQISQLLDAQFPGRVRYLGPTEDVHFVVDNTTIIQVVVARRFKRREIRTAADGVMAGWPAQIRRLRAASCLPGSDEVYAGVLVACFDSGKPHTNYDLPDECGLIQCDVGEQGLRLRTVAFANRPVVAREIGQHRVRPALTCVASGLRAVILGRNTGKTAPANDIGGNQARGQAQ